jgi:diadenosine tetraphosphate (Ap4A) HIT family hydrolase
VLKPHAVELYDLCEEDAEAFVHDVRLASRVLQEVTGAIKINYEIHGNTIPHLHMHLWPRQVGDRFENAPIDWRMKDPAIYSESEFGAFIQAMREAIGRTDLHVSA